MTTIITTTTTLAEIVNRYPDLARELERRSLDYCCGGRRTLAEACQAKGLDPDLTADELAAATSASPAAWAGLGPAELVDHLEATHHAYLHDELPRLSALVHKVAGVHGDRHPELVEIEHTYDALRAELEPHLMREERVLFPMVRELAAVTGPVPAFHCGSLANPISVMLADHDRAGDLLSRLRRLTGDYAPPDDACASYTALYAGLRELESDTHLHVHKENNLLFPAVIELQSSRSATGSS
jgi:regulator of cell morphogenesis and NO signaling